MSTRPRPDHSKWEELLLSQLLHELRSKADEPKVDDVVEYAGNRKALKQAKELRKMLRTPYGTTASTAGTFIREAAGAISDFLSEIKPSGGASASAEAKKLLEKGKRVESALIHNEAQLRLLLPDPVVSDEHRWPGPISYRSALNHFVAVCIRVHSIAPDVAFDEVVYHVAKRVLIPSAAHNMKFAAKEHPAVYHAFVHEEQAGLGIGIEISGVDVAAGELPSKERHYYRKWARLFNVMVRSAKFISPERKAELFRYFQKLLKDYEVEPRTSQLWQDLSVIASGDMAVDEIVVSRVLDDIGMGNRKLSESPLVNCARARFGLLRYAYDMRHEAEEFKARFTFGEAEVGALIVSLGRAKEITRDDELVKKAFGWAYILSRHLLLGRQAQASKGRDYFARQQDAANMLHNLLDAVNRADVSQAGLVRLLALRYLIGFLTNPRFLKSPELTLRKGQPGGYYSEIPEGFIRLAEKMKGMPNSIISMARARVVLHYAIATSDMATRSRELQSSLKLYSEILEELASPGDAGVMDGEVIAWVLPEIYFAIEKFSQCRPGDEDHWTAVQKSLLVLGEVQYGVYYNPQEEMKRIENGLLMAVGKQAMK